MTNVLIPLQIHCNCYTCVCCLRGTVVRRSGAWIIRHISHSIRSSKTQLAPITSSKQNTRINYLNKMTIHFITIKIGIVCVTVCVVHAKGGLFHVFQDSCFVTYDTTKLQKQIIFSINTNKLIPHYTLMCKDRM